LTLHEADGHKCPSLRRRFDIIEVGGFCPPTSLINLVNLYIIIHFLDNLSRQIHGDEIATLRSQ